MTLESKMNLNETTIEGLQELIQMNIDAEQGFLHAATVVEEPGMTQIFRQVANERKTQANELRTWLAGNSAKAPEDSSWKAAFHRAWMTARTKFSDKETYAALAEAERGEDAIKERYEDVLKETAGSAMSDVLHKQYRQVKSAHDRIRNLRDARAE